MKPPEDFLSSRRFGSTTSLLAFFFFPCENRGADLRTESGQVRFEKNTKNHQSHSDIEGYNHSNSVPFCVVANKKKGLVVVVVVGFMKKMVGFLSRVWRKNNIYGGGFFLVKKQKTTFAKKTHHNC